jgi:glycolate oxidase FAD binding subunit
MVIEPQTAEEVAAALRDASDRRHSLVIRGAGTKSGWGRPFTAADVTLGTGRLNRLLAHEHGDLVATAEAGATLRDINGLLARHGQCLPLDPPFDDRATIGGILATNDSGPLRHRYGTPRDLVIGVRLATTDGVLAKAGGNVVKNVAGYDLSKLVSGSFGALAAIVTATFKLTPLPAASKTLVVTPPDADALGRIVRDVMASQLEPIAFDVHVRSRHSAGHLSVGHVSVEHVPVGHHFSGADAGAGANAGGTTALLRFATVPAAVDAQIDQAQTMAAVKACTASVLQDDAERDVWRAHADEIWSRPGAIVRASWLPADLARAIDELARVASGTAGVNARVAPDFEVIGRAAVGAGLIRIDAPAATQAGIVGQLRASSTFGNIVVVRGSDELKSLVDVWGPQGDRVRLFAALKRALDPNGILNAGRGPL